MNLIPVKSSAIRALAVADSNNGPVLMVAFHSNPETVYEYTFEDTSSSDYWNGLLTDDSIRDEVSWGSLFHKALKHGDIETI